MLSHHFIIQGVPHQIRPRQFGGQMRKFNKHINHFEKFSKANRFFFAVNARFFEYYVRILALKIEDNLI